MSYRVTALFILLLAGVLPVGHAQLCRVADGVLPAGATEANSIASDGSQFVLVTDNNRLYTSDDAVLWTERLAQGGISSIYNTEWTGLEFVGMRGRTISVSPDGITWEDQTPNTAFNVVGVAWDGLQTVVAGNFFNALNLSVRPDGGTWSAIDYDSPSALSDIIWDGTQFIAAAGGGIVLTSPDAVTWTEQSIGTTTAVGKFATDGTVVMAMAGSTPYLSTDGVMWTEGTSPGFLVSELVWVGQFIAGGIDFGTNEATVAVSDDGTDWIMRSIEVAESQVVELAGNGDKVLAVTQRRFQNGPPNAFIELGVCPVAEEIFSDSFE
ncbi:MAG: hypothetical protein AAGA23_03830 [Pseudomonadota bacterium]